MGRERETVFLTTFFLCILLLFACSPDDKLISALNIGHERYINYLPIIINLSTLIKVHKFECTFGWQLRGLVHVSDISEYIVTLTVWTYWHWNNSSTNIATLAIMRLYHYVARLNRTDWWLDTFLIHILHLFFR